MTLCVGIGSKAGGNAAGATVIVSVPVFDRPSVLSSATLNVIVYVAGPSAAFGVHENKPVFASSPAPEGTPETMV